MIELSPTLRRLGVWAPANWADLNAGDADLGSSGPIAVPGTTLLFEAGKPGPERQLRLPHGRGRSGRGRPGSVHAAALARAAVTSGPTPLTSWEAGAGARLLVFAACGGGTEALVVDPAARSFRQLWTAGASANGSPIVAGGLVWALDWNAGELYGLRPATGPSSSSGPPTPSSTSSPPPPPRGCCWCRPPPGSRPSAPWADPPGGRSPAPEGLPRAASRGPRSCRAAVAGRERYVSVVETAIAAVSLVARARTLASVVCAGLLLAACGSSPAAPRAATAAERQWVLNAGSFIGTLQSDVLLSTVGGANLASARRALTDTSSVMTMLVAYDLFSDCGPALANAGTPGAAGNAVDGTLIAACGKLESASALFQTAMTRHAARPLLAATRMVLTVEPLLSKASSELAAVRRGHG